MPTSQFHTQRRIEFADTDMAGIVHFARFFVFMETTEHEFLRSLGREVHFEDEEGRHIGWPRVKATCEYFSPVRFGEILDIRLEVRRKGRSSMTYRFHFRCGERRIAGGEVTSICCALPTPLPDGEAKLSAVPIPAVLADAIEEAPAESAER